MSATHDSARPDEIFFAERRKNDDSCIHAAQSTVE